MDWWKARYLGHKLRPRDDNNSWKKRFSEKRLLRKAQKHGQAPRYSEHFRIAYPPEGLARFLSWNRHGLVNHNLWSFYEVVCLTGFKGNPENGRIPKVTGYRKNSHGGMFIEQIGLDHKSGAGFAIIALESNGNKVAPPHSQPSVSDAAAIKSKISRSWASLRSSRDCRRHSRTNSGLFVSGTQICMGRIPDWAIIFLCLRTRSLVWIPIAILLFLEAVTWNNSTGKVKLQEKNYSSM
jgi:hypothetical protein